jgi:ATP/maltotriose-dependent transcriptional regulator MalT
MTGGSPLDEATVRRWLGLLRHPNRLDSPEMRELLRVHGRLPPSASPLDVGRAAARFLIDTIDRLAAPPDAPAAERLPHAVLKTCFVEGAKLYQAAQKLGLSERQLTRERGRAISLLTAQLVLGPVRSRFLAEEIPPVGDLVPRPELVARILGALDRSRVVHVHGPPGIGKTTVAAEVAVSESRHSGVLWHRFRRGVNDTLGAVIFEMSQWLSSQGIGGLSDYVSRNLAHLDTTVAARLAIRALAETAALVVLDDYQIVEDDLPITGFFDEALMRTPTLRMIVLSRHRPTALRANEAIQLPPFRIDQTERLLARAGRHRPRETIAKIHAWTGGNPQLVRLSAAWLKAATPQEMARGVGSLSDRDDVQAFLLSNVTELLDSDDREILEAASIFRGRFSDAALAYVARQTRGAVQDTAQRLVRSYVATRSRQGVGAFVHESVRDYVYERLDQATRAALHLRAAAWFHRLGDENETAYHRSRAGLDDAERTARQARPGRRPTSSSSSDVEVR